MSEELWAALIGGPVTAVATAVLTYLFSPERRQRNTLGGPRRRALTGLWRGTAFQRDAAAGYPEKSDVELSLKAGFRTVTGTGRVRSVVDGKHQETVFSVRGGFTFANFFRFGYTNTKGEVVQFGSGLLELNPKATELCGRVVGYGAFTKQVVGVEITLIKVL